MITSSSRGWDKQHGFVRKEHVAIRPNGAHGLAGQLQPAPPGWDKEHNMHLFMRSNLEKSQALIGILAECDLQMVLPKNTPTLQVLSTGNFMRPENIFISSSIASHLICCRTLPDERPARVDHIPIIMELDWK